MNKDKVQNQNILGTLVNKDESGIIAYSDQIYDKKSDRSLEEENVKQNERLDNIEAKDRELQSTLENITKTGEASAASNVIYNHNDSQLDASNVQQAIDEVRKRSNYNDGDNIIDFNTIHLITDNPEYICVAVDADEKILYGIKTDGQPYFGVGCPEQVKEYVEQKIAELSLDEYEDIVAFLNGLEEGDKTLQTLLNEKVDKEEGKSLIDADYASSCSTSESPEFLDVKTDAEGKILEATKEDGTKVIYTDFQVLGNMEVSGVSYKVIESPEYLAAWVDAENKVIFGFRADGKTYVGDAYFLNDIKNNQDAIKNNQDAIKNNQDAIAEIKPLIDKIFNGKKVSILGDSISTFNQKGYMIPGYAMYYPTAVGDRGADVVSVNDTWWMQVINSIEGVLEVNASFSGSTASNRAIGFSPRVPLLGNPDIIYIALGTNDSFQAVPVGEINFNAQSYDLSQFAPAYIKGMQDTIAAYPKAKIICIAFDMKIDYQNAIKIIAEHYGAEYIYVGDITDVHPNKSEMTAAANKISPALQIYFEDNPEYIKAITDSIGRLIEAIGLDGVRKFFAGINIQGTLQCVTDNPEYIAVWIDNQNRIVLGFKTNGDTYFGYGVPSQINSLIETLKSNTEARIDTLQQSIDNNILALDYNSDTGELYSLTGETSTINASMDDNGDVYLEQEII